MESANIIHRIVNRFFPSNTYLFGTSSPKHCIVIDPGLDGEKIDSEISNFGLVPVAILCTHGHFDHTGGVAFLKNKYGDIPYYVHEGDLKISQSLNFYMKLAKIDRWVDTVKPDHLFAGSQSSVEIDGCKFNISNFPGHTQGSCVIKEKNHLFTGDLIYTKGLGLNNFPGENKRLLKKSITELLGFYDEQDMVYPGHGSSATLGEIKKVNEELITYINSSEN